MFNSISFDNIKINDSIKKQKEDISEVLSRSLSSKENLNEFIFSFPQSLFEKIPLDAFIQAFVLTGIMVDNEDKLKIDALTQKHGHNVYDSALNLLHYFLEMRGVDVKKNINMISDAVIERQPDMYFYYKENYQLSCTIRNLHFFAGTGSFKHALDSVTEKDFNELLSVSDNTINIYHTLFYKADGNNIKLLYEKIPDEKISKNMLMSHDSNGNTPLLHLMQQISSLDKHLGGNFNNNVQIKYVDLFEFFQVKKIPLDIYHENNKGESIYSLYTNLLNKEFLKDRLSELFIECEKESLLKTAFPDKSPASSLNKKRI